MSSPPGEATYLEYCVIDAMLKMNIGVGWDYFDEKNWVDTPLLLTPVFKSCLDAERTGSKAVRKRERTSFTHGQNDVIHRLHNDVKGGMNHAGMAGNFR